MSLKVSSAIPISAVLHGMEDVARNVACCYTSFLYFIQLIMFLFIFLPDIEPWTFLHLRYNNLATIKLTIYLNGKLEFLTWVWGIEIASVYKSYTACWTSCLQYSEFSILTWKCYISFVFSTNWSHTQLFHEDSDNTPLLELPSNMKMNRLTSAYLLETANSTWILSNFCL